MGRGLLILVSGFVLIVGLVQKSILDSLKYFPERTTEYHQEMTAKNISTSLMEYGISEITNNQNWEAGYTDNDFMGAEVSLQVFTFTDFQNNNPDIPSDHNIQNWDKYTLLLVSEAKTNNAKAVTEVGVTKDAFSKYTYFTDYEPNYIYFYDGDELNGPVHTNGTMHVAGEPIFNGKVTSPNKWEGHPSYNNNPHFNGGKDFQSKENEMPDASKLNLLKNKSTNGGLRFNDQLRVEFKKNGTVDIFTRANYYSNWSKAQNYDLDKINGVISSSKKVYTEGTLKGQVTLHSENDIEIMGDLTYFNSDSTSKDMLGIVSENNVVVDDDAHKSGGPSDDYDLNIHASIMALNKSFKVEDYNSGNPRGTLKVHGGLQQKERGAVGTFSGGSVASGYNKDYTYDKRLATQFPPFYPRESFYSKQYWKEKPIEYLQ
ncbi:hypothetical protein [Fodinibius saliphilus]|uniref:hypothetical protein n=1 Tax=Fodinibius saliphilus TaxID=1920650 RepID=UPI001107F987|nr:hypothetical protein [Fodinibius saliphilus]